MGQLKIGSESFNVEIEGPDDAPILMLSNSLGTDLHMWDPQMSELTKRFRVVRYDARGHGHSIVSEGPYSIAQLGRDALAIMDELELDQVNWLGLSMGGMVGQWLVSHAPQRILRAVLANTSSYMPDPRAYNTRIVTVREKGMAAVAQTVVDRWFTPEFQASGTDAIAPILAMLHAAPLEGYMASCAAIRDMDQRESIRSATTPVLVIAGSRDPATPPELGREIASSIPGASYVELEAAHLSNVERPVDFTAAVMSFLTAQARKAVPKKTAVKKAATKKGPAKKGPPKKGPAKKGPAKKGPAKKAAVKKAAAKKATAKKNRPVEKGAAKKAATRTKSAKAGSTQKAGAKTGSVKKAPPRTGSAKKTTRQTSGKAKAVWVKPTKSAIRKAAKRRSR